MIHFKREDLGRHKRKRLLRMVRIRTGLTHLLDKPSNGMMSTVFLRKRRNILKALRHLRNTRCAAVETVLAGSIRKDVIGSNPAPVVGTIAQSGPRSQLELKSVLDDKALIIRLIRALKRTEPKFTNQQPRKSRGGLRVQ